MTVFVVTHTNSQQRTTILGAFDDRATAWDLMNRQRLEDGDDLVIHPVEVNHVGPPPTPGGGIRRRLSKGEAFT